MDLKNKISDLAEKYFNKVIEIRRHLHKHPELSFEESETAKYIISLLNKWGVRFESGIADNGIAAYIEGKNPQKRTIALRADMDALPVSEENVVPYKSINNGIMHACGHDAHTASLLGTLLILKELTDNFEGTIKFIFQPAEEKLPGGAKKMIEEGVLENPIPEFIIGQHVYPELPSGKLGFKKGMYMASTDELFLTVIGKGGHAAMPDKITNTVLIASQIIVALQKIPQEIAPKEIPTVLTIGKVIANGATNVVPDEVSMEGTFRTMDETNRKNIHLEIEKVAQKIAESQGARIEINIKNGYPVLFNNKDTTVKSIKYAKEYLGEENVVDLDYRMTGEDFAYYSQKIPATFYRLGTSYEDKYKNPLHSPTFNIHEESLKIGMGTMAYISICFLKNQ